MYTPKTGAKCGCKRGQQRDNCPNCEGTGYTIDFKAIHARRYAEEHAKPLTQEEQFAMLHSAAMGVIEARRKDYLDNTIDPYFSLDRALAKIHNVNVNAQEGKEWTKQ